MGRSTSASSKKTNAMAKESSNGKTAANTTVNGVKASNMASESTPTTKAKSAKENGWTESVLSGLTEKSNFKLRKKE